MADRSSGRSKHTHRFPSGRRTSSPAGLGRIVLAAAVAALSASLVPASLHAQENDYYQPLNQRTPLGETAGWLSHIRGCQSCWLQPIRIEVPGGAKVSVYSGSSEPTETAASPALVAVNPGHTYRLRLADMPEFPDVELYPSIEILDRLHPPAGEEFRYPIPIPFSARDIAHALEGRLVTRVIYLEQPQLAQQLDPLHRVIPQAVHPTENVLQEADRMGRPMVIIRLGSRRPSAQQASTMFFGTGGNVQMQGPDEGLPQPQVKQTALRTTEHATRAKLKRQPQP